MKCNLPDLFFYFIFMYINDKNVFVCSNKTGSVTVVVNRRGRTLQRTAVAKERNPDGTEKIYATKSSQGKVYLKKISISLADRRKKRTPVKYPLCSTFSTKTKHRSILLLPQHELRKLARLGGRTPVLGFNHSAKVFFKISSYKFNEIFYLSNLFYLL